ncbi:hypothetical protein NFI96_012682 [Prochilodus magdalenae]|nr:hypothetical protein NFI96_012682 [Prochilodus magdalenae]
MDIIDSVVPLLGGKTFKSTGFTVQKRHDQHYGDEHHHKPTKTTRINDNTLHEQCSASVPDLIAAQSNPHSNVQHQYPTSLNLTNPEVSSGDPTPRTVVEVLWCPLVDSLSIGSTLKDTDSCDARTCGRMTPQPRLRWNGGTEQKSGECVYQKVFPGESGEQTPTGPPQDHHRAGSMWVVDHSQHCRDTDVVVVVLVWVVLVWTVRGDSSSAAAQCSVGRPLVLHQRPQDAAHRTLPTGRCPQDAAHRTLPHRTQEDVILIGGRFSAQQ